MLKTRRLSSKLLKQGYHMDRFKSSFRNFYGRYAGILFSNMKYVKRHADPRPVFTYFMNLTITEIRMASTKHLHRVWHASRERLHFRTVNPSGHLVPSPFGTCLCSNCWSQLSRTCRVFSRFFTCKIPRYFLNFASSAWGPKTTAVILYNYLCLIENTSVLWYFKLAMKSYQEELSNNTFEEKISGKYC